MLHEPDDRDPAGDLAREVIQGGARGVGERGPEQQVLRRVPRNGEFRREDDRRAVVMPAPDGIANTLGIAVDVTDDGVDLRTCNPHGMTSGRAIDTDGLVIAR